MSKIITISGASGVGKTTLAKWIAEEYKIPFVELSTKPLWKDWGIQSHKQLITKTILEPNWGLAFQYEVLKMREKAFQSHDAMVCDRGVWDAWVYFIMQVAPFVSTQETQKYLDTCQWLASKISNSIFIRLPFEDDIEDDDMRITNWFYQESFDCLMDDSADLFNKYAMQEIKVWDMEMRKDIVRRYLGNV